MTAARLKDHEGRETAPEATEGRQWQETRFGTIMYKTGTSDSIISSNIQSTCWVSKVSYNFEVHELVFGQAFSTNEVEQ